MTSPESGDSFHHLSSDADRQFIIAGAGRTDLAADSLGHFFSCSLNKVKHRPRHSGIQLKCDGNNFYSKSTTSVTTTRAGLEGCGWKTVYEKKQWRPFLFDTDVLNLPDSPDRSDLAGGASGWGCIKLSVGGLPFR